MTGGGHILPNPPVGEGERAARSLSHLAAAGGGAFAIGWAPETVGPQIGAIPPESWGAILLCAGLVAAWASQTGRYLVEWPTLVATLCGCAFYLVALWALMTGGNLSRGTQTLIVTAYALLVLARILHLKRLAGALKHPQGG